MFSGLNSLLRKILPKKLFYRALLIVAVPVIVLQLMERDAARPTQAQLPVAAPKQSPAASGVVASDDTMTNLALALSTNAQTIHHLVKGGRLAP